MSRPGSILLALCTLAVSGQTPSIETGRRYDRIVIRNAIVIEGNGTPAAGPKDVLIEKGMITQVVAVDPVASANRSPRLEAPVVIDASGKYVMPGLINAHGHIQDERGGSPQPVDYCLKLWLASGITTVRDVGSRAALAQEIRRKSAEGQIAAPRIFIYSMFGRPATPEAARMRVQEIKTSGGDGIKTLGLHRDIMQALAFEARATGLPIAHHAGVEETNAWDDIRLGTRSIEHWYGIPDAAIEDGVQNFPPSYNYNDEVDRFRYAGRLWREAKPELLAKVFDAMIQAGVAWDPTLSIYEASRDLTRAQNQPWFKEYLHPTLARFFEPNRANHGSYFFGWTTADEIHWKENYRIWMAALRDFERRGGLIGVGEDAGFIYSIYGFGLIRELELHQEAGFHPLKVIQHATLNNARILNEDHRLGRVRAGYAADILVLNSNPLENFKILYPGNGGIEWTIKDGIPYHAPSLAADVRKLVKSK